MSQDTVFDKNNQTLTCISTQGKNQQNDRNSGIYVSRYGHSVSGHSASSATPSISKNSHEIHDLVGLSKPETGGNVIPFPVSTPKYLQDIESLTEGQLKKAYPGEFNSWRSRRDYAYKKGIPFYTPWETFSNFLKDLGPTPTKGYTLDNIDRKSGYIPGNVRWASKEEQAWNRETTVWIFYQGETLPIAEWARRTNQNESTLRKRKKQGLSDEEVITGTPFEKKQFKPLPYNHPWPISHKNQLEKLYRKTNHGESRIAFLYRRTKEAISKIYREADYLWENRSEYDYDDLPIKEKQSLDRLSYFLDFYKDFNEHAKKWYAKYGNY